MPVCRFFLQGNCKFGNQCKNEHPSRASSGPNRNPFAPLQESSNNRSPSSHGRASGNRNSQNLPFNLNKDTIITDLSDEHPQWILSAYGPGTKAPVQLFGGLPREQSFEEMRVRHYELAGSGKQQEAVQEALNLVADAENQMKQALANVDGAIQYIVDGERQHPNRNDVCQAGSGATQTNQASFRNQQTATQAQLSTPGNFGRAVATAGGQPTAQSSPFGNTQGSTFGQPSFGQPSLGQSSFGQPSFASPSAFNKPGSGIGQSSNAAPASASTSSPFGTPQQTNPFQQTSQTNPFASRGQSGVAGFGQSSLNPSSLTVQNGSNTGAFNPFAAAAAAKPNSQVQSMNAPNAFARTNSSAVNNPSTNLGADASQRQPTSTAQIRKDNRGNVVSWNGRDVSYVNDEPHYRGPQGEMRRIWFPDGPPTFAKPSGVSENAYDAELQAKYEYLKQNGRFQNGEIPLIPPKKEWCNWNL